MGLPRVQALELVQVSEQLWVPPRVQAPELVQVLE